MLFELKDDDSFTDFTGSTRIDSKCALVGYITQAYEITAQSGAKGITIDFTALNGKTGQHTLYTINKDGGKNEIGINAFKSVLFLLGVKQSAAVPNTTIKKYDFEAKKDVNVKLPAHTAVMGKKIGAAWDMREWNGKLYAEIKFFFDPETRQTAGEKQDGEEAFYLGKWLGEESNTAKPAQPKAQPAIQKSGTNSYYDDDIPF